MAGACTRGCQQCAGKDGHDHDWRCCHGGACYEPDKSKWYDPVRAKREKEAERRAQEEEQRRQEEAERQKEALIRARKKELKVEHIKPGAAKPQHDRVKQAEAG